MMKKIKILLLITLLTICALALEKVDAYTFTIKTANTGESFSFEPFQPAPGKIIPESCEPIDGITITSCYYEYTYNYKVNYTEKITLNSYDMWNNPLTESSLEIEDEIKAGTSVGISMYSIKEVGYERTKFEVKYYYTYETTVQVFDRIENTCGWVEDGFITSYAASYGYFNGIKECNETCRADGVSCIEEKIYKPTTQTHTLSIKIDENNITHSNGYKEAKKLAITAAGQASFGTYLGTSTYTLVLPNSNDINESEVTKADEKWICYDADGEEISESSSEGASAACQAIDDTKEKDSKKQITYFTIDKVCMDIKTANVRYVNKNSKDQNCLDDEIEIKNDTRVVIDPMDSSKTTNEEHWHYFVPLNAKSTDKVSLDIRYKWVAAKTYDQCLYVMQNNKNYTQLISKIDDTPLSGDFYDENGDDKCTNLDNCSELSKDFKEIYNYGCNVKMEVYLPIDQQFYKEVENNDDIMLLKGFSFYYRPIDINNPFPNKITDNSVWNNAEYYDQVNNKILTNSEKKLSDSYKKITYATKIDTSAIRKYNIENNYTDWENMNIDGTSSFITNENIIQRYVDKNTIYKLGCGPLNDEEYLDQNRQQKNPLYRSECDVT